MNPLPPPPIETPDYHRPGGGGSHAVNGSGQTITGQSRRWWTLMDRMLFKDLLGLVAISLVLFTIIWLAPETLFRLTGILFEERITTGQFGELLLYHLPKILEQSIPLAALFGSIFLFRKLSVNLELISLLNCGISPNRILKPILVAGLLLMTLHLGLQEGITPLTGPRYDKLKDKAGLSTVRPTSFTFVDKTPQGRWKTFFMMENIQPAEDGQAVKDVFLLQYTAPAKAIATNTPAAGANTGLILSNIVKGKTALWQPKNQRWRINNATVYTLDDDGLYTGSTQTDALYVSMPGAAYELLLESLQNPKQMSLGRLMNYVDLLRINEQEQDQHYYETRLIQKIVFPLSTVVFIIVGAFLGMEHARSRRHYAIIFGALLVFAHSILTPAFTHLGQLGLLWPWLAAIMPLILTSAKAYGLIRLRQRLEHG
jgi:lipopolysaccharide export LptBFGC system permease protein LptF